MGTVVDQEDLALNWLSGLKLLCIAMFETYYNVKTKFRKTRLEDLNWQIGCNAIVCTSL